MCHGGLLNLPRGDLRTQSLQLEYPISQVTEERIYPKQINYGA